jgi:hypothetical protein
MVLEPKTKYPKGEPDILRRLPVMRLSMVVQRLLDMERSKAKQVGVVFCRSEGLCAGEHEGAVQRPHGCRIELKRSKATQVGVCWASDERSACSAHNWVFK